MDRRNANQKNKAQGDLWRNTWAYKQTKTRSFSALYSDLTPKGVSKNPFFKGLVNNPFPKGNLYEQY